VRDFDTDLVGYRDDRLRIFHQFLVCGVLLDDFLFEIFIQFADVQRVDPLLGSILHIFDEVLADPFARLAPIVQANVGCAVDHVGLHFELSFLELVYHYSFKKLRKYTCFRSLVDYLRNVEFWEHSLVAFDVELIFPFTPREVDATCCQQLAVAF
jgi:hypothetical protein